MKPSSSTSASASRPAYHHGDLKTAMITLARQRIEQSGPDGLSLREIAGAAGVSHGAAYRHFASKRDLLAAVAAQGFDELAQSMRQAMAQCPGQAAAQLKACGASYVLFGGRHPWLLQLMFGATLSGAPVSTDLSQAAQTAYDLLMTLVLQGQSQGVFKAEPAPQLVATCWALVHGLATLLSAQRLRGVTQDEAALHLWVEQCTVHLIDGLSVKPVRP